VLLIRLDDLLWPMAVSLLLAALPGLLTTAGAERRRFVAWALGAAAVLVLLTNAAVMAVGDDEVFYLADSWAARNGETAGMLPMRYLLFRPFLLPGLGPRAAVIAGRMATCGMALLAAAVAWHLTRRLSDGRDAGVAAAVSLLWLATAAEMVFLRPEYFACLFVLIGVAALLAPPRGWPEGRAVIAGLAFLTLAAATSHRQVAFPLAGVIVALRQRGATAGRTLAWCAAGIALAAAPSLAYVLVRDSFRSLWYWNWTFVVHHSWVRTDEIVGRFPVFLFLLGLLGGVAALGSPGGRRDVSSLGIFWAVATALALFVPFGGPYAMGPWYVLSVVVAALLATRLVTAASSTTARRAFALGLGLLAVVPLMGPVGLRWAQPPFAVVQQTALLEWLQETSGGGPVACVSPFHPIKARNAWRLWNAWWYCYLKDRAFLASLEPGAGAMLRTGEPRIIGWDPWPEASGHRNVLAYAVDTGLIPAEEAPAVAQRLAASYRLVRFNRPGPERFGGSRFLVRREIPLDDRVTVLADQRIAP